jgi:hypothetical protein
MILNRRRLENAMMSDHADRSASVPVGSHEQIADAVKFLELLLSECNQWCSGADHSWRKCRRCLAFAELEGHKTLARGFIETALAALRVPEPSATAASKQVRRQLVTIMDQNGSEPALAVRRMMSEVITPLVLRLAAAPPVVGGWQAIESAPKEGRFDVWAKAWLPAFDRFEYRRFTDCYWRKADSMGSWEAGIVGLDKDWRATHWMPLPPAPGVAVTREELPQNDYAKRLILAQPDDGETR